MAGVWVFGYGSLVSPRSFGHTLGRELVLGVDLRPAEVSGYGRRWNHGVMWRTGETDEPDGTTRSWTIVALGLVAADHETVNGVIAWADEAELETLDRRERHYDRVDVTGAVVSPDPVAGPVVTYVPRREPIHWYEAARDRGTAAVERRYFDLVHGAFADLGGEHHRRFRATTPPPDVPIVAMRRDTVPRHHLVHDE